MTRLVLTALAGLFALGLLVAVYHIIPRDTRREAIYQIEDTWETVEEKIRK